MTAGTLSRQEKAPGTANSEGNGNTYTVLPEEAFRKALAEHGIDFSGPIHADGELHRFHVGGDKSGTRNGWYVLHNDGTSAGGAAGSWKTGVQLTWTAQGAGPMPEREWRAMQRRIADAQAARERERAERHEQAAETAAGQWEAATPADPAHPYLVAKGVQAHGIRQRAGALLVPGWNAAGELQTLQSIDGAGEKRFLPGGAVKGAFHLLGTIEPGKVMYVAEGYSTAATIHEATGQAVAMAFNCGNLKTVAEALSDLHPEARLVVACDNDTATEGNPGLTKGREAAAGVGAPYCLPTFTSGQGTDFNDLHATEGREAVLRCLAKEYATVWPKPEKLLAMAHADSPGWNRAHEKPRREIRTEPPTEPPEPWGDPIPLGGMAEAPPEWPWEAMPEPLRAFARSLSETYNLPEEMAAAGVLGIASIALANKAKIELKRDHRQFGNLLFLTAAPVGAGKTPLTKALQAPLIEWQKERRKAWGEELRRWQSREGRTKAQIRGLEKAAEKDPAADHTTTDAEIARLKAELGEPPPEPVLFCDDATSEALGRRMQANGGAIGVLSGEARKLLSIAKGRYVEGGDIDLWLAGHAGDFCRVDRSGKASYEIPEACLSAFICTQPDSLQSLGEADALRESGFLARWLYLCPEPQSGDYPTASVPEHRAQAYRDTVRRLIDLAPARYPDGEPAPHLVKMTPEAFQFWREYHDETKREIANLADTGNPAYRQWLSKLPETVARLALVLKAVSGDLGSPIAPEVADAAMIAEALKVHARRACSALGESETTARARKVWRWIDRHRGKLGLLGKLGTVKPRDIHAAGVAGIGSSHEAETVLDTLADHGYLQRVDFRPPGTKTQTAYLIHPTATTRGTR